MGSWVASYSILLSTNEANSDPNITAMVLWIGMFLLMAAFAFVCDSVTCKKQ